jgi:hypothetical protein
MRHKPRLQTHRTVQPAERSGINVRARPLDPPRMLQTLNVGDLMLSEVRFGPDGEVILTYRLDQQVRAVTLNTGSPERSTRLPILVLSRLLAHVNPHPPLSHVLTQLFIDHRCCRSSPELLAMEVGVSRRTLDRWLRQHSISSTRLLFACARLTFAYTDLSCQRTSLRELGVRLGCATARPLQALSVALTGFSLRELTTNCSIDEFVESMVEAVTKPKRLLPSTSSFQQ